MKKEKYIFYSLLAVMFAFMISCSNPPGAVEEETSWEITDTTLKLAIEKEFKIHPYIDSDSIIVKSDEGIVTLLGMSDNLLEKEEAAELAKLVRGVRGVINLIDVKPKQIDDVELKQNVEYALSGDPVLTAYRIVVDVDNAVVNLHGMVDSWHEKQLAAEIAKKVGGIRQVNNEISFLYPKDKPDDEIRQEVASLLRNDIMIEDGLIEVNVDEGTVRLSGTVGSSAEKSFAIVHAWVPGVDTVIAEDLEVSVDVRDPLFRKDKYVEKSGLQIIDAIQEAYLQDPRILKHDIKVEVNEGNVTLTGSVSNLRAKRAAEETAWNIVGVKGVTNKLEVQPVPAETYHAAADKVRVALDRHPMLDKYGLSAKSGEKGSILLEGQVEYYFEKAHAEEIAANVRGVTDIKNNIEVLDGADVSYTIAPEKPDVPLIKKPHIKSDEQLREDVAYQLWWSPFVDRNQVEIEVNNGEVTLRGTVNSEVEMRQAVKNAYEGGAFSVNNELKIDFWEI